MNERMKRLANARAKAWDDYTSLRDGHGDSPTAEQREAQERALGEVERLDEDYRREERAHQLGERVEAPAAEQEPAATGRSAEQHGEEYRTAFDAYLRRGIGRLSGAQQEVLERGLVPFDAESRAQAAGVDAAGGYTVPEQFLTRMTEGLKAFGGILGLAEVITTTTGSDVRWPSNDDTANEGEILGENTQVGEQDFAFGNVPLGAYMYTSKMVRVSLQLLQDSAFDMASWLPRKLGERIGRAASGHFATGTGTGQPQGLTVGLTGPSTAAASTITFDDLITLEHSVDPAYRENGRYVAHDTVIAELRKKKDSQGQYLWSPGSPATGVPATLNGRPYTIDNKLPEFGAGAKPLVFGDIRAAYVVRQVAGAQTLRLNERYADYLQAGFLGFQRLDARVQDAAAAKALTITSA